MPELCRFLGIIIRMFYNDHAPPHFHILYGSQQAVMDIESLALTQGKLSPRVFGLVAEWASLHQAELRKNWENARDSLQLSSIEPLE